MIRVFIAAAFIAAATAVGVASPASADVYYKNCDAARAAGPTPIFEGQPGYAPHLDRDGDGIACES
jgi:Excalibur calcium-binding domain